MSHDLPAALKATDAGPTAARASFKESKLSMCQNNGPCSLSGSDLFSIMLHPNPPRRSGEFSTQGGASCAVVVFAMTSASTITTHVRHAFIVLPPIKSLTVHEAIRLTRKREATAGGRGKQTGLIQ